MDTYINIYKGRTTITRNDYKSDQEMSTKDGAYIVTEYQVLYGLWCWAESYSHGILGEKNVQDLIYWAGEALSLSLWIGCMICYTWPSKRQEALWYPISGMKLYKISLWFECSSHLPLISLLFVLHRHSSNKCFTYVIFIDIYSLKDLGSLTHTHTL